MSKTIKSHIYNNVTYDSLEEIEFQKFLDEAKEKGFIKKYIYQPPSYELIPKATETITDSKGKTKEKVLYRSHSYTADWIIYPNQKFIDLPHKWKINYDGTYIVDIKGTYNLYGGDRILPIHQKLLYEKFKLHLNKVNPQELFLKINIVPESVRWMSNRKEKTLKKIYKNVGTFDDYIKNLKIKEKTGKQINTNFFKSSKFND